MQADSIIKFTYRKYDPEYVSPPFGLNNNGAICWLNSVIQFLLGIPSPNELLIERKEELEHNNIAREFINLLEALMPNNAEYESIDQSHFAGASSVLFYHLHKKGIGSGQQCADEGFTIFLQELNCLDLDNLYNNAYRQSIKCSRKGCEEEVSSVRDLSNKITVPPTKNFGSDDEYRTWLSCQASLPLDHPHRNVIPNFKNQSEFQKWILNHCSIVLGFKCEKCGHAPPIIIRRERLTMAREVIVLSFDMFDKIDPTWYPEEFVLPSVNNTFLRYKLCGKICWSGSINRLPNGAIATGGHYWAHSLREGKWLCFNDNHISEGSPRPCANTFMIAYHLTD
jgi:ubiquitin C-terminal hydrolase